MSAPELRVIDGGANDPHDAPSRVPPHDHESEALICGTLLIEGRAGKAFDTFATILVPEHFESEAHRRTYEAACAVAKQHGAEKLETATIVSKLTEMGRLAQVGGVEYLRNIRDGVGVTGGTRWREWAIAVHDAWRRRRLLSLAQTVEAKIYVGVPDTQAFCEEVTRKALWISNQGHGRSEENTQDLLTRLYAQVRTRMNARESGQKVEGLGAPIFHTRLDSMLRGLRADKKITVVARPGCGKSAIGMQWLSHAAQEGFGGLYYGVEPRMSRDDHMYRLISATAHVDSARLVDGLLEPREVERVQRACADISRWPLHIIDARGWSISRVRSDLQRRAQTFRTLFGAPLACIVLDHIHALEPEDHMRTSKKFDVVAHSTTKLADLAAEMHVCVIELAQEKRGDKSAKKNKRPDKGDISDTSEIEKSTESIMFLRPLDEPDRDHLQKVRAWVVKNTSGEEGDVDLTFVRNELRFIEERSLL